MNSNAFGSDSIPDSLGYGLASKSIINDAPHLQVGYYANGDCFPFFGRGEFVNSSTSTVGDTHQLRQCHDKDRRHRFCDGLDLVCCGAKDFPIGIPFGGRIG